MQHQRDENTNPSNTSSITDQEADLALRLTQLTQELELKQQEFDRKTQIDGALEKVRVRSLAMHRSEELQDVIRTVLEQLVELGFSLDTTCIIIPNEDKASITAWLATVDLKYIHGFNVPWSNTKISRDLKQAFDAGVGYVSRFYTAEEKSEYYQSLFSDSDFKFIPEERKAFLLAQPHVAIAEAGSRNSWIQTLSYHGDILSEEQADILKRFAGVFDQCYTRFQDIQKAEALARDAQIEAAVERVRAKALAMHQSGEINTVVRSLRDELDGLRIPGVLSTTIYLKQKDGSIRFWDLTVLDVEEGGPMMMDKYVRLEECPDWLWFQRMFKAKQKFIIVEQQGQELENSLEWIRQSVSEEVALSMQKFFREENITHLWHPCVQLEKGLMNIDFLQPPPPEVEQILLKMGAAFDLAYKRFSDLKNAEAQAREAQIQLSLERVRSRAMAMHHSDELSEVLAVLFEQFDVLNIRPSHATISIIDRVKNSFEFRMTGKAGKRVMAKQVISLDAMDMWRSTIEEISQKKTAEPYINEYPKEVLPQLWELSAEVITAIPDEARPLPNDFPNGMYEAVGIYDLGGKTLYGTVSFCHNRKITEEEKTIVGRFATEFGRLYQRFLDLQKAEAQAREAQIEAALERVRSRAMAMHSSKELQEVVHELRKQLGQLGEKNLDTCVIHLNEVHPDYVQAWAAIKPPGSSDEIVETTATVPKKGLLIIEEALESYIKDRKDYVIVNEGEKLRQWFSYVRKEVPEAYNKIIESTKDVAPEELRAYWSYSDFPGGSLLMVTTDLPDPDSRDLLRRFANVFGLAYRRFADLMNAEAQAREAQIEAALERVRSRSLAMHKSNELSSIARTMFDQLKNLGLELEDGLIIMVFREGSHDQLQWPVLEGLDSDKMFTVPTMDDPILNEVYKAQDAGIKFIERHFDKHIKDAFLTKIFSLTDYEDIPIELKENNYKGSCYHYSFALEKYTGILLQSYTREKYDEEHNEIIRRFARVFEQAYVRFLDLQKAEAQAREAQIEASLERLRSKTMAMNNSNDVGQTVATMFGEFENLGIHTNRCGILVFEDEHYPEVWTAKSDAQGKSTMIVGKLNRDMHQLIGSAHKAWKNSIPVNRYDMVGADLINYYDAINKLELYPAKFDLRKLPQEEFHYDFSFPEGVVFAFCPAPLEDEQERIMKRFAAVFGQTYRRYLDLQTAEANAKEAIKQAALDRIRAEIASMRTKQDLDRITPLIWNELNTLKISFIRCGIFIMNDGLQQTHTYLSTPDGHAIASFNLPYDTSENIADVINHWHDNKTYVKHWDQQEFSLVADSLVKQGEIATREQYMQTVPPEGIFLHFLPFMQGMLYVGNVKQLETEEIDLVQTLAYAFSSAYARYEDFNKVETTLNDLRETQKQLIQAEKMASLGELTAGIAHEIQNPLNFVNNFSQLNTELVAEGREAISSGNLGDAEDIFAMVLENEQKILHHGKRADAIVKGMLQHSRANTGTKEPTDLNALADEYLRLAFHGMRAHDKNFQSDYIFTPDPSMGKVNVVPQDMGRVLLNLINNAFYAVHEKATSGAAGYNPSVEVKTTRSGNKVLLTVRDNGNGIPDKIREKIFEPFFTTKPTGEGTGLGLSLSYDIVRSHGGEIRVESVEGVGSSFTVIL